MEQTAGSKFQMQCPGCGQRMLVSVAAIGKSGNCPYCKRLFVPGHTAKEAADFAKGKGRKGDETRWQQVQKFICSFSGLRPLEGFHLSYLSANPFRRRTQAELDAHFDAGSPRTTPPLAAVSTDWPRPWFFWRLLVCGVAILLAFIVGYQVFDNRNMLPGIMITGAFCVPLACVALFFEFNVLRNISVYQVLKFMVCGGAVSLVVALGLYATTHLNRTFLGATSAGIIEETAKTVAAVLLLRGAPQWRWILNGLLVGAAVGAGFAGFETAGYLFNAFLADVAKSHSIPATFYETLFLRAVFAPFCHIVWTASVIGALWRVKQERTFHLSMLVHRDFLRVLAFVILLHMLWNSGLLWGVVGMISTVRVSGYLWLTAFVGSWYLALLLVQEGLWQVRAAQLEAESR